MTRKSIASAESSCLGLTALLQPKMRFRSYPWPAHILYQLSLSHTGGGGQSWWGGVTCNNNQLHLPTKEKYVSSEGWHISSPFSLSYLGHIQRENAEIYSSAPFVTVISGLDFGAVIQAGTRPAVALKMLHIHYMQRQIANLCLMPGSAWLL